MRQRKKIISQKERSEIIDLFELSPLTVVDISRAYGLCRLTIYRTIWKNDNITDLTRKVKE